MYCVHACLTCSHNVGFGVVAKHYGFVWENAVSLQCRLEDTRVRLSPGNAAGGATRTDDGASKVEVRTVQRAYKVAVGRGCVGNHAHAETCAVQHIHCGARICIQHLICGGGSRVCKKRVLAVGKCQCARPIKVHYTHWHLLISAFCMPAGFYTCRPPSKEMRIVTPAQEDAHFWALRRGLTGALLSLARHTPWLSVVIHHGASVTEPYIPAINLGVHVGSRRISVSRRAQRTVADILREGRAAGTRIVWVPIGICACDHFNALWIDMEGRRMVVFEPHGSDLAHVDQTPGIMRYYDSADYVAHMRRILTVALTDAGEDASSWRLTLPPDYLPAVFGQTWTEDSMCVFWAVWFLFEATMSSPEAFVQQVMDAHRNGSLRALRNSRLKVLHDSMTGDVLVGVNLLCERRWETPH